MMMNARTWQIQFQRHLRKQLVGARRDDAFFEKRTERAALDQIRENGFDATNWRAPERAARLETVFIFTPGCDALVSYLLQNP